jgi:hypothetical protein
MEALHSLFGSKKSEFLRRAERGELPKWMKEVQVSERQAP